MAPLFAHLKAEQAHTYSLVMASADIHHTIDYDGRYWCIKVPDHQRRNAQRMITLYLSENSTISEPQPKSAFGPIRSFSAAYAALLLVAVQLAVTSDRHQQQLVAAFGADARQIMTGQIYRCITALLLHAGWPHLLGNVAATIVFGTFTAGIYGWGIGWILIVLSGAQGNFLTAWWYENNHLSVGASTAVFAALGLCAAATFRHHLKHRTERWRSWLPLAGGLALVGWLGTSPQSDLIAHLTGFLSGIFYGVLYAWKIDRIYPWPIQATAVLILAGIISGCWYWGLSIG